MHIQTSRENIVTNDSVNMQKNCSVHPYKVAKDCSQMHPCFFCFKRKTKYGNSLQHIDMHILNLLVSCINVKSNTIAVAKQN